MAWSTALEPLVAPARPSLPRIIWAPTIAAQIGFFVWLGYFTSGRETTPLLWITPSAMLVGLAHAWDERRGLRDERLWMFGAAMVVCFIIGGLPWGAPIPTLGGMGLANLVAALSGLLAFRFRGLGSSWVPRTTFEAVWLTAPIVVTTTVGVLLGAVPGAPPGTQGAPLLSAFMGTATATAVTVNCVLPLYFTLGEAHLRFNAKLWLLPYLLGTAVCTAVPWLLPDAPLSWLYVVPAVWAGLVMTPRIAAASVLSISLAAAFLPSASARAATPNHWIIAGLSVAFLGHVCLLIIIFRTQAARISAAMDRRAVEEHDRVELLTSVLKSMRDGMWLLDHTGAMVMANDAAAKLLAPPPPRITVEWARSLSLRSADDDVGLSEENLARVLVPATDMPIRRLMATGEGEATRYMLFTNQALNLQQRPHVLLLFRDMTGDVRRARELESFAGSVARDLKLPLRDLVAWTSRAEAELADERPAASHRALQRAQDSADRMERLIAGYLTYAIRRDGHLASATLALAAVIRPLTDVYADHRREDGSANVAFDVDTPHSVYADPALTRQLVANVLAAAVSRAGYGDTPRVRIDSALRDGRVLVRVWDNGPVPAWDGAADAGSQGAGAGHGLDLELCEAIAVRLGGDIASARAEAGGSVVTFELPAAPRTGATG